jgi:hypothetical protein
VHIENIPLRFAGSAQFAQLRELSGREEFGVTSANTSNAINLLSRLLDCSGTELRATDLVASDRDRLLASVYVRAFGDRIESTLNCKKCSEPFDLDFSLARLLNSVDEQTRAEQCWAIGDGSFETAEGVRFRLPTGKDELELSLHNADAVASLLLERCVEQSTWTGDSSSFEELLERVAPLLEFELVARCAECSHVHMVQFDIQTYVLGALISERRRLLTEINRLARAYSWSLEEILSLSRSDRRQFVELIDNEYVT